MAISSSLAKVVKDIKTLKIQGSQEAAEAALRAYARAKDKESAAKLLMSARPTEPMLFNVLRAAQSGADPFELIKKFREDRKKIAEFGAKLIPQNSRIFTHCHSSTVVDVLKQAKKQGKSFEVHNTETRPKFQGRITATELAKAGIKVCHFTDSAVMVAMAGADLALFGADWISEKGVANKIGTAGFAEIAHLYYKIPVWICSHSWKFSEAQIEIEQRDPKEIWPNAPKGVHIHNPAFDIADAKFITGVVSELGILEWKTFIKKMKNKENGWL